MSVRKTCFATVILLLISGPVASGPIFSIVSFNSGALQHPADSTARRAASGFWGISATGGGFYDGTLVFADSFVLPAFGATAAFTQSDLLSVSLNHTTSAFAGGGAIVPVFTAVASGAQIVSAAGTVVTLGSAGDFTYGIAFGFSLLTDVSKTLSRLPGGLFTGNFGFDGTLFQLYPASGLPAPLVYNSEYAGSWRQTGFTPPPDTEEASPATGMPLPPTLALFALGLLAMRRKITA
jgi:hypothetical protein